MYTVEIMYHYAYCPAKYVYMSVYLIAKKENYIDATYYDWTHLQLYVTISVNIRFSFSLCKQVNSTVMIQLRQ